MPPSLRWTYTYGNSQWRDLLTAYDGQSITYDQIGNPLIYRNGIRFAWVHGRQMSSVLSNGVPTYYTYNADGTRHSKTTSTNVEKTTTYYYVEGVLYAVESPDYTVVFQMDDTGRPYGFRLLRNDSPGYESQLYYKYNLQGDVVGIYDFTGNEVVTYTYDPWGKLLSATGVDVLIDANPLLYRGYVYDKETGFYYCNSRYYDPETGRWLNADGLIDNRGLNTQNMFQYCGNNPVMYADSSGQLFGLIALGLLGVGLIFGLSGCSSTPASAPSTTTSAPAPSKTAPIPSQPTQESLTTDQKVLIATIAAEATVTAQGDPVSSAGRQAMANVALNRVGSREWSKYTTVAEICQFTGFDGYGDKNYQDCMTYLNSRDGSNATYEAIIWDVMAAYDNDITNGAQLYYTPAAMNPAGSCPNWNFSVLTEVTISGVDPYYEGRFYRYK